MCMSITPDEVKYGRQLGNVFHIFPSIYNIFYSSFKIYVKCTRQNRIIEANLTSTQYTCMIMKRNVENFPKLFLPTWSYLYVIGYVNMQLSSKVAYITWWLNISSP